VFYWQYLSNRGYTAYEPAAFIRFDHKKMKKEKTPPDHTYQIRCPKLGHQIYFPYCQSENMGRPCFKTLDCWFEHFLVEDYFRETLSPEDWEKSFGRPPTPKMVSLIDLIDQAKKRREES